MNIKRVLVLLCFLVTGAAANAQDLNVYFYDQTSTTFEIEEVRSLTFSADSLNVTTTDGVVHSWSFNFVNYYNYKTIKVPNSTADISKSTTSLLVYPNPSSGVLNLSFTNLDAQKGQSYDIVVYDQTGKITLNQSYVSGSGAIEKKQLDLATLSNGTYICEVRMKNYTVKQSFILSK